MNQSVTINEAFHYSPGTHGFTEAVIYDWSPTDPETAIPVLSGSSDNMRPIAFVRPGAVNNKGERVAVFEGPAIILTKDGSAGLMTFLPSGTFTINHHACVLKLREQWQGRLDPEWFALRYWNRLAEEAISKSDNQVLSTRLFDTVKFGYPDHEVQLRVRQTKRRLGKVLGETETVVRDSEVALRQGFCLPSDADEAALGEVFTFLGGNSGLTEEAIYNNWPEDERDAVKVLSSSTIASTAMGAISSRAFIGTRRLKVFEGPCLAIARKGTYAGTTRSIPSGQRFTINDDAYVLGPRDEWKNRVNLCWFAYQYERLFMDICSAKGSNATLAKSVAKLERVRVPRDRAWQDRAAASAGRAQALVDEANALAESLRTLIRAPI